MNNAKTKVIVLLAKAQKATDGELMQTVEEVIPLLDNVWLDGYKTGKEAVEYHVHICKNCKYASSEGRGDWSCNLSGELTGDYDTCERWHAL